MLEQTVALLAEGVDRNTVAVLEQILLASVALLAEGVDRNDSLQREIDTLTVALLAEGVDRNLRDSARLDQILLSPSSRRAWIEMFSLRVPLKAACGRPPRGGRG